MTDEELDEIARRRYEALCASFAQRAEEFWASRAGIDLLRRFCGYFAVRENEPRNG